MTPSRERHGCLTAWLIFMILGNSFATLSNLYFGTNVNAYKSIVEQQAQQGLATIPNISSVTFFLLAVLGIFNLVCASVLFNWKRWGFYGFMGSAVAAFIINISIGMNLVTSLLGFVGVAVLYGVLNIGGENKAWTRLE